MSNIDKVLDDLEKSYFSSNQTKLMKKILNKFSEEEKEEVFSFLIQKVKTGLVFNASPYEKSNVIPLMIKDKDLSFTLNENAPQNSLIIGENYDALKNLILIENERRISGLESGYDLIYIDPPYNTENKKKKKKKELPDDKENVQATKFVYRDKYSRNGWLNLMNERLKLAKELLKDDGVIFVSIDDAEQAYLKVLMDEIFGEENFITNFIWQKKSGGGINTYIYEGHEYILLYSKNKLLLKKALFFNKKIEKNVLKDEFGYFYWENDWLRKGFGKKQENSHRNIFYEEINNFLDINSIKDIEAKLKSGEYKLVFNKSENKHLISRKERLVNSKTKKVTPYSILNKHLNVDFSGVGVDELYSIIKVPEKKEEIFNTVKPLSLLKVILDIKNSSNTRILDFFAGSGTTGHAVLELNKEDGGNRTFTLVTNNENNIGIDVNYERLYRINHGIGSKGETFEWANKNEPYKSNLNVYNIKYYDISLFNNIDVKEIVKELIKLLKDFGVNSLSEESEKDYTNLLNSLR